MQHLGAHQLGAATANRQALTKSSAAAHLLVDVGEDGADAELLPGSPSRWRLLAVGSIRPWSSFILVSCWYSGTA